MTSDDLCFTAATELASLIRRRRVSPLEITQAVLERIARVNPAVTAYCTVAAEQALEAATVATAAVKRRGARLGPLHGVPVSIKDLTPTQGIRTTWGSKIFEHHVPDGGRPRRAAAQGGRRHRDRQDEHAGVRGRRQHRQRRLRRHAQSVESRPHLRRFHGRRRGGPRPRSRPPRAGLATSAARCACPRPSAASSASARRPASCPSTPRRWRGTA